MNTFDFSQPWIQTLGWALLHFLWQGAAIAALLFLWQAIARPQSARARYLGSCLALLLMAAAPVTTFTYLHSTAQTAPLTSTAASGAAATALSKALLQSEPDILVRAALARQSPVAMSWNQRLEAALPWLAFAWMGSVLVLSLRLLAGWTQLLRLRRHVSDTLPEAALESLARLTGRLGIQRPVRLYQSLLVEVPTLIGWWRPIILFPASALSGLSLGQIEAILAHELAHVRRHDYLVNLFQKTIETLLFYHPAVWWISTQVAQERENCCDDLTVSVCGDHVEYVRALATLEELRQPAAQFGLAATGGSLLPRVRRLLGLPTHQSPSGWWIAGAVALLTVTVLLFATRTSATAAEVAKAPEKPAPRLQVRVVAEEGDNSPTDTFVDPASQAVGNSPSTIRVLKPIWLDESHVESARPIPSDSSDNQWEIHIVWNDSGRAIFTRLTSQHIGKRLAVIYDGNFITAPRINEPISGGKCNISGRLSKAYAERIAAGIDSKFGATSSSPKGANDAAKPVTAPRPLETALIARTDTDVLVQDALLLIRLGKLESARERLNEALKREPNHSGALSFLKLLEQKQANTANRVSGTQDQSTTPEQSSTNASETWLAAAVRRLVRDAELLRDLGKVSEAEAKMNEARTLSSLSKPVTPALVTRTFKLGAGFIDRLLELGVPSPDVDSAVPGGAPQQTEIQSRNFAILKAFTDGLGLHFTEPFAPEQPESTSGRAIFLNDRKGILFVRATLDELEVLDQALQVVNTQPQQVTIEVKFAEITGDTTKALGFDWFLGNTLQSNTPGSGSTPSNELPITTVTGLPTPPTNTNAANVATITGILTDPQFRVVIRALEQRGGVDVLSAPKVTTLSGRQARIEMTEKRAIVIAELGKNTFSRTNISVGPSIDVLPVVSPDGRTIQLELNATVTEFLGYDDPSQLPNQPAGQAVPLPRFRVRQGSTTASMFDGQTVVLSGFPVEEVVITKDKVPLLGNIPILGRLFRNESKQIVKKNLIVMVTPTLIDAAGNRIHRIPDAAPAPAAGSSGVFPGTPPAPQP